MRERPGRQVGRRQTMLRSIGLTSATSAALLLVNSISGILIARLLDTSGKGTVTAITTWIVMGAWIFALGVPAASTFLLAKRPAEARSIVGTALAAAMVLGLFAMVATQVLVLFVFANQPSDVRWLAHVTTISVLVVVLTDFLIDVINGDHDFGFLNLARLMRQLLKVVVMIGVWLLFDLSVALVLAAFVFAELATGAMALHRVIRRIGSARPSRALLQEKIRYGLRLQGGQLAGLANHRLDLLIMPLFLATSAIGLYSVAISVSSVLFSVVSAVRIVIFPAAARAASAAERIDIISRSLRLGMLLVGTLSIPLFVAAPILVPLVYGESFAPAVTSLRILLIGFVFRTGSSIVVAGLKAANRPLGASVGELAAIPITIIGLVLVLDRYGIEGAAVVSTIAYGVAFVVGLLLMSRQDRIPLTQLLSPRQTLADAMLLAHRGWRAVPRPASATPEDGQGTRPEASVEERA